MAAMSQIEVPGGSGFPPFSLDPLQAAIALCQMIYSEYRAITNAKKRTLELATTARRCEQVAELFRLVLQKIVLNEQGRAALMKKIPDRELSVMLHELKQSYDHLIERINKAGATFKEAKDLGLRWMTMKGRRMRDDLTTVTQELANSVDECDRALNFVNAIQVELIREAQDRPYAKEFAKRKVKPTPPESAGSTAPAPEAVGDEKDEEYLPELELPPEQDALTAAVSTLRAQQRDIKDMQDLFADFATLVRRQAFLQKQTVASLYEPLNDPSLVPLGGIAPISYEDKKIIEDFARAQKIAERMSNALQSETQKFGETHVRVAALREEAKKVFADCDRLAPRAAEVFQEMGDKEAELERRLEESRLKVSSAFAALDGSLKEQIESNFLELNAEQREGELRRVEQMLTAMFAHVTAEIDFTGSERITGLLTTALRNLQQGVLTRLSSHQSLTAEDMRSLLAEESKKVLSAVESEGKTLRETVDKHHSEISRVNAEDHASSFASITEAASTAEAAAPVNLMELGRAMRAGQLPAPGEKPSGGFGGKIKRWSEMLHSGAGSQPNS